MRSCPDTDVDPQHLIQWEVNLSTPGKRAWDTLHNANIIFNLFPSSDFK